MSFDIIMWKWKSSSHISPIMCSLLLNEGMPVDCVSNIESERLQKEIEKAFPDLLNDEIGAFELDVTDFSIVCCFPASTPAETLNWFIEFANRNDLFLYDYQAASDKEYKKEYANFLKLKNAFQNELNRKENIPSLEAKIKKGNPDACIELGNLYYFGEGIEKDYLKAFKLYNMASDLGNKEGKFNVASCFRKGEGITKDVNKAIEIYQQLIENDPLFTGFELGSIYCEEPNFIDLHKAIQYLTRSANAGNPRAIKKLKELSPSNKNPKHKKSKLPWWNFWSK